MTPLPASWIRALRLVIVVTVAGSVVALALFTWTANPRGDCAGTSLPVQGASQR
jgi:hypothetical protein